MREARLWLPQGGRPMGHYNLNEITHEASWRVIEHLHTRSTDFQDGVTRGYRLAN